MKAKIGDRIVITDGMKTNLYDANGLRATVRRVDETAAYIDAKEIGRPYGEYYLYHGCYMLEEVYESPLMKALR